MAKKVLNEDVVLEAANVDNVVSIAARFEAMENKLNSIGQGQKYAKVENGLLFTVKKGDLCYLEPAKRTGNDNKEYYVLPIKHPTKANHVVNITMPEALANCTSFEIWLCKAVVDITFNGNTIKKGTERVKVFAGQE